MTTLLLALAVLPAVVLSIFIYRQDKMEKEPIGLLIMTFFAGVLSILPAVLLETQLSQYTPEEPLMGGLYRGYCVAGFSEELCKLILLMLVIWRNKNFNEYFDGIVYATYIALGFACFENISYVFRAETFQSAVMTGSMRALLSVPGHFLFGVVMGYYVALAKFDPKHRYVHLFKALLYPILLHGTFDALLMIPEGMSEGQEMVSGVLFIVFILFDIKMWKTGKRRIRRLQELSQQQGFDHDNPFAGFKWEV